MESNTENMVNNESAKIWVSIKEIKRLRNALPGGSLVRIGSLLGLTQQAVTNEFSKIVATQLSEDGRQRQFNADMLRAALKIIQQTGNKSFDHILK